MSEWKFGDVIRRHADGDTPDEQAHAMVIAASGRHGYRVIGLRDKGMDGYRTGKTEQRVIEDYWTLVTDE